MSRERKQLGFNGINKGANNKKPSNAGLDVTIARTIHEVESLREIFEKMQPPPLADIDYLLTLVEFKETVIRPNVIVVSRNGKPETLFIGLVNNIEKTIGLRDKTFLKIKTHILGVLIGGVIGNIEQENCEILISELRDALKRGEADAIYFQEIPTGSKIYKLAQKMPGYAFRDHFPQIENHYRMILPSSLDDFYNKLSSKQRKSLRSNVKKLDKKFCGRVSIRCFRTVSDTNRFCQEAEKISKKSWQSEIGAGFIDNMTSRKLLSALAMKNHFLGFILYVEDRPCAFSYGYMNDSIFFGESTGYDVQYKKYAVGNVLLVNVIKAVCEEPNIRFLDFGWMGSEYKNHYCDQVWEEANFYIYRASFKGCMMNLLKTISNRLAK